MAKNPNAAAPHIVLAEPLDPTAPSWLKNAGFEISYGLQNLHQADGLVVRSGVAVTPELLQNAPKLKVVGRAGVGVEHIHLAACRMRNIQVVHTPFANTQAVVEYTLGCMLQHLRPMRPLQPGDDFWKQRRAACGREVGLSRIAIWGCGRIGSALAQALASLGASIALWDCDPKALNRVSHLGTPVSGPKELLEGADLVSVHVDGRASNRHLINAHALSHLKPSATLFNTSRGLVVDPHALQAWLKTHASAGAYAYLDVHTPEPPNAGHPLWDTPNAILLPHAASQTHNALMRMGAVVRDVAAVLQGQAPKYPVNLTPIQPPLSHTQAL